MKVYVHCDPGALELRKCKKTENKHMTMGKMNVLSGSPFFCFTGMQVMLMSVLVGMGEVMHDVLAMVVA
jgi:hypothetical protein